MNAARTANYLEESFTQDYDPFETKPTYRSLQFDSFLSSKETASDFSNHLPGNTSEAPVSSLAISKTIVPALQTLNCLSFPLKGSTNMVSLDQFWAGEGDLIVNLALQGGRKAAPGPGAKLPAGDHLSSSRAAPLTCRGSFGSCSACC